MPAAVNASLARRAAVTFLMAAVGGALFEWLRMPAGWLSGGMLFVAAASLGGLKSEVPEKCRWLFFLIIGIFAGSGANPQTLEQIGTWPASFGILMISIAAVTAVSYVLLNRLFAWDSQTALFSSLPGALSFVLAAVEGMNVDVRKVAIAQSIRLLILVEIFPLAVLLTGRPSDTAVGESARTMAFPDMLLLIVGGAIGGIVVQTMRLPGGLLLGGLLVSAGLFLSGTVSGEFPAWLIVPGMIGLGAVIGSRVRPGDRLLLPTIALASVTAFCAAMLISALAAQMASLWLGISFIQTFLAFAPGAFEAVAILAFAMQVDPAYVAAHHVARFFVLALFVPVLARWIINREERSDV